MGKIDTTNKISAFSDFLAYSIFYKNKCKNIDLLKQYWDECTPIYVNNDYPVFQSGLFSNDLNEHLEILHSRHWQDGSKKVLDAGCGIGHVTTFFAKKHPETSFTGITVSPEQAKLAKETALGNSTFITGSYDSMPFDDETFDFIYFYQSIGYRPLVDVLNEAHRVLKPGGKLLISDMCSVDDPDPQQTEWIKYVQDIWHYMCYPSWYHLEAASLSGFKLIECNPNMNPVLDYSKWGNLVDNGLGQYHNCKVPFSPIKVSEFLYQKPIK